MNLNHLKYFFDAASKKNLSHAAKCNRVSQSAISQAIRALENQLGCQLIFHKRNRFQLTEAGETTLQECQKVFESLEKMRDRISEEESDVTGELKFGCSNSVGTLILPEILSQIQHNYPKVRLKMRLGNSKTVQQWLLEKEIDVGFIADDSDEGIFGKVPIQNGVYRLFSSSRVNCSSLNDRGGDQGLIVTRLERPEVQRAIKTFRDQFGTGLKVLMEVTSWEVIKSLVLSGMGIGLCPEYVIEKELKDRRLHLVQLPRWECSYQIDFLHLKNRELSKQARLLLSAATSGNTGGNVKSYSNK